VRRPLAQRQVILAAAALLAAAVSLAFTTRRDHHDARTALPPAHGSYSALAAATGSTALGRTSSCGVLISDRTMGIGSPVLPCGARLYLTYNGRHVLASVIDRADAPGAELVLTYALSRRLGITGVKRLHWSYAGGT
jgi:hypothetical protein